MESAGIVDEGIERILYDCNENKSQKTFLKLLILL